MITHSVWKFTGRLLGGMSLLLVVVMLYSVVPVHALSSGANASTPSSWPMYNYSTSGARDNTTEKTLTTGNVHKLVEDWHFYDENLSAIGSSVAIVQGIAYFGTADDSIYAVNAQTGVVVWKYTAGNVINSSPAVVNGVVYVGSNDQNLYALNATTGTLIWKVTTGGPVQSSPTVANGIVYVGNDVGILYALNAATGAVVWTHSTGTANIGSSPAVGKGDVYIISGTTLFAFSAKTGKSLWSFNTGGGFNYSSPIVVNGVVYVWNMAGSANGNLYALSAGSGTLIWDYASSWFAGTPAIANGIIYFCADRTLYAMNASTEAILWSDASQWDSSVSPAVANGLVYYVDGSENLFAANISSGSILWEYLAGGPSTAITVANGEVFAAAGAAGNEMLAFHLPA